MTETAGACIIIRLMMHLCMLRFDAVQQKPRSRSTAPNIQALVEAMTAAGRSVTSTLVFL